FGGAGMVAKSAVTSFENLPADLKTPPPPQRSRIVAFDGTPLAYFYAENRIPVKLAQVPDVTRNAVIAIEDSRFYEHKGVDLRGITRAFVRNQTDGQLVQGASTITQQYVKRVLVQDALQKGDAKAAAAAVDKNQDRKIREIRYALALEQRLSKEEILERYLNITYYGAGAYGIGAAAQVYFGKPVSKLTLAESALLAGLLQSPSRYDPLKNKGVEAVARRNVVLARMGQLGFISSAEADRAIDEPLKLHVRKIPNGCASSPYGHFCDYVRRYLLDSPDFGKTREQRQDRLFKGGLTIRTTLQPRQQKFADAAAAKSFPANSRYVGALAVVQPGTGRVTAIAESRPFNSDQVNYVTGRRFQTGSTAKAFVLTAALSAGMPLTTTINSPHDYTSPVFRNGNKAYSVSNDARGMSGPYDMRSGIAASVNTYYVQLEERVGVDNAVRAALALGVSNPVINTTTGEKLMDKFLADPKGYGSFTLGVAGVTPLDMATAYATLAAKGLRCLPTPIESVVDSTGKPVNVGRRNCKQTIDPGVAAAATNALSWVVNPQGHVTNGNTGG
ncbi:MAG: transglycosylase domain-containing protein, partial [Mycobacteriales bacterium]